jgi:hypothetical protein
MKAIIGLIAIALGTNLYAQSSSELVESAWKTRVEVLKEEYFAKLSLIGAEQIQSIETFRKEAMASDNLDEAVKLRAIADRIKSEVEKPELPEDKSRLAKDRMKLLNVLRTSKWNCSDHENFPRWAGKFIVFHENGTIVPSVDLDGKWTHHRWAVIDGRHIVALFGNFLMVFRLSDDGNSLIPFEWGPYEDEKAKRGAYKAKSLWKSVRDAK